MRMNSLQKCFNGDPFCWNQKPEEIFCYKVNSSAGFPKGDALYRYDNNSRKWSIACAGDSSCGKDCLVHAYQQNDPEVMNRVYYNTGDVTKHLDHIIFMKELKSNNNEEKNYV